MCNEPRSEFFAALLLSCIENIHKDKFNIDYLHEIAYFIFEKYEISCGADGDVKLGLRLSDLNSVLR